MPDTALHSKIENQHPFEYQFAIEYMTEEGEPIGFVPFDPDWLPAREWAIWESVRRGQAPATGGGTALHVAPVWDEAAGAPVMSAASIEVSAGNAAGEKLPTLPYFRSAARVRSAEMVEQGLLQAGAPYLYRVCAYARAPGALESAATRCLSSSHSG